MSNQAVKNVEAANLPKVELHRHLEGALRLSTVAEVVRNEGLDLPTNVEDLRKLIQVTPDQPHSFSNFLSKFRSLRKIYRSSNIIQRVVREAIQDASNDHIRYLELRFSLAALSGERDFPLDEVADWVIEAATKEAEAKGLRLRLIMSVNRHEPPEMAEKIAQMAVDRREKGIVGLGLAGNEAEFPVDPFQKIFLNAQSAGLKTTIHAGEWAGPESVRHALLKMNANRIGHGIRVLENDEIVAIARERKTVFEVCISSNVDSGIIDMVSHHPLQRMIQEELQVTLNTDDPGISNIKLTDEYLIAQRELGLSLDQLKGLIMAAARAAFLEQEERKILEAELRAELFS